MNRNVLYGGVAAVAVLLGTAGYLIFANRSATTPAGITGSEMQGPETLNPVTVITDHTNNLSQDGKRLSLGFTNFELAAKAGETTTAVFSTTWHIKIGENDRVVVATSTVNGFMKSTGIPPVVAAPTAPAASTDPTITPAATPATAPAATTPADPAAAPAADTATTPASGTAVQPAKPAAPPVPTGPVAGDGVARVIVAIGSEASVTEWHDHSGTGGDRRLSKAVSYVGAPADLRDGGSIPVTVTVELSGGSSADTLAKLNSIDLQVFVEDAPKPTPVVEVPPAAGTVTTVPPAADTGTTPTPPATDSSTTTPAPAPTTTP